MTNKKHHSLEKTINELLDVEGLKQTVAICGYYPEQWHAVRESIADPEKMPEDYGDWFDTVTRAVKQIEQSGFKATIVYADVQELAQWCKAKGYANDTQARALFASFKLTEQTEKTTK